VKVSDSSEIDFFFLLLVLLIVFICTHPYMFLVVFAYFNFDITNIEEVELKIRENKTTMLFKEFPQYLYKKMKPKQFLL